MEQGARKNQALMLGKCKNQTKAPKRSVKGLKRAFYARLRDVLPAFAGTFEPKWVVIWVRCNLSHQYRAQSLTALEQTQERIFFLFRLVGERASRSLSVVGEGAGFDLALLREGCAQHVEWLIGRAFDGAVLFVEDFNGLAYAPFVR